MSKKFQNLVEYIPFIITIKLFSLFPYKLVLWKLKALFVLIGYGIGIRKKVAYDQMKMVFPGKSDKEIRALLKKMYKTMGASTAEVFFSSPERTNRNTEAVGIENVHEALKLGRGVILASAHFGNWESCIEVMNSNNIKLTGIAKKQRNTYFDNYENNVRAKRGVYHIPYKNALKMTLKKLSENYAVAIVCDQNAGKTGVRIDFLGHPASAYVGPAKIALKTKTPIIPCIALKLDDDRNRLIFEKPIYTDDLENNDDNMLSLTKDINHYIEKYILEYPHMWFWVHKRWKGAAKARVMD
jgi:KDO2-lipid IV(A) lauroyltransferase